MTEKTLRLRKAKPNEGAWWKVSYKLPKNFVSGAAAGTIPGFTEQTVAGFFVVAKSLGEAKLGARKMFAEFRRRWGKHAFSLSQEQALDLKFKRISMSEATHEECLPVIMNKAAKIGDPYWDTEDKQLLIVHKILPRGQLEWSECGKYLPKNYTKIGKNGYATYHITIDPENEHDYLMINPNYL